MNTLGRTGVVAVIATLAGVAAAYAYRDGGLDRGHLGQARNAVDVDGNLVALPLPDAHPQRLAPIVVTDAVGEFSFASEAGDRPVLHDPCAAIHWQLSRVGMPAGAEALAQAAVGSVSRSTGIVFVFDGYTDDQAAFDGPVLVDVDGWGCVPMVIGWGTEAKSADLDGDTTGVGGAKVTPGTYDDRDFLRSGTVMIDTSDVGDILTTPAKKARTRAEIMHELAHVVGLDHGDDPRELMFPAANYVVEWGPGDLQGLAAAGAGACESA